jgi:antitoxin HigA-1
MATMHNPPHPGAVLKEALSELPITITYFAEHIGVARSTVTRILAEEMGISADMSVRLSQAFGQNQPDLWLRMQTAYDIWHASQTKHKIKPLTSHVLA